MRVIVLFFVVLVTACDIPRENISEQKLPGTIAEFYEKPGEKGQKLRVFKNGTLTSEFTLSKTADTVFNSIECLNNGYFLASRKIIGKVNQLDGSSSLMIEPWAESLVVIDSNGVVGESLLRYGKFVSIGKISVSPNTKLVFFTSTAYSDSVNGKAKYPTKLNVLDIATKTILTKEIKAGIGLRIQYPWSLSNERIYFTLNSDLPDIRSGVYTWDIEKNNFNLFIPDALLATASSVNDKLAIKVNDDIYIYDCQTGTKLLLYEARVFENIALIRWSPDGEFIRIKGGRHDVGLLFGANVDRLIRVSDGEIILFEPLGINQYSWK